MYFEYMEKHTIYVDASCSLWAKELNILPMETLAEEWENILVHARKISNASKLQYLQYKILNRCLVTNITRSNWDKSIDGKCTFCDTKMETILHLFVECKKIKKQWVNLSRWFSYFNKINLTFDAQTIIFNKYEGPHKLLMNTMILIMKQFIYSSKCKKEAISFQGFIGKVGYWYNIEKHLSMQSDKM